MVRAVLDASNIYTSSPKDGEDGNVNVLAAVVSTKYLLFEDSVIFDETAVEIIGVYELVGVTHVVLVPSVARTLLAFPAWDGSKEFKELVVEVCPVPPMETGRGD